MPATASPLSATRDILGDLIAFPTISPDSNLDLIAYAADRLEACGARLEYSHDATAQKANLFATLGPEQDGRRVREHVDRRSPSSTRRDVRVDHLPHPIHIALFQRIVISTCSVSVLSWHAGGPVVLAVNSTGESLRDLAPS